MICKGEMAGEHSLFQDQPPELSRLADVRWAYLITRFTAVLRVLRDIDDENSGDR